MTDPKELKKANVSSMIHDASETPNKIANDMIDDLIMEKIGNFVTDRCSFSLRSIFTLILLMSIGEFKKLIRQLIRRIFPTLQKSPAYALLLYSKIGDFYQNNFRKRRQLLIEDSPSDHEMVITVSRHFCFALYNYIHDNSECQFEKETIELEINNLKDHYVTEIVSEIMIKSIRIINDLVFEVSLTTGEPTTISTEDVTRLSYKSYIDLFDEKQQKILLGYKNLYERTLSYNKYIQALSKNCDTQLNELTVARVLIKTYPHFNVDETALIVAILLTLTYLGLSASVGGIYKRFCEGKKSLIDQHRGHKCVYNPKYDIGLGKFIALDFKLHSREDISSAFGPFLKGKKRESIERKSNECLKLILQLPHTIHKTDVVLSIREFVQQVCVYQRSNIAAKIKVHTLTIDNIIVTNEKLNPEYSKWKKAHENNNPNDQKSNESNTEADAITSPPKTIMVETVTKVINDKFLNERGKSIDTLYLRETDMKKLLTSLNQFRDNKEIFTNLGLPNKLNVLLFGAPGTGKSATIEVIATYLNRTIYYLNLRNATSNQDLQMMIEHVNKNVQNGGIIVLEDIDAMTDVVLKREDNIDERVRQVANSTDELTLEYFLNILQGTLTLEDSIFIVTTNHIEHLDPALYRDGRFDVKIELRKCDRYQIQCIYQKFFKRKIIPDLLQRIPEDTYAPATIIYHLKDYLYAPDTPDVDILAPFLESK